MTYPSHSIQSRVTRKLSILGLKGPLLPPPLSILLFLRSAINKAESNEKKKICTSQNISTPFQQLVQPPLAAVT